MKQLITFLCLCLMAVSLTAQTDFRWVKGGGGPGLSGNAIENNLRGFAVDKHGNTYVGAQVYEGFTLGDSVFHPPYGSFGSSDAFIAKYDKCGKLIWFRIIGSKNSDAVGILSVSPDERYIIAVVNILAATYDSVKLHLQNRDTILKSVFFAYLKIDASTGEIIKIFPGNLPYPTGANYEILNSSFISANRLIGYPSITGNFNGTSLYGSSNFVCIFDSNLNIIRYRQIDTGAAWRYYSHDFDLSDHPSLITDIYGYIYSEVIKQPSNPSTSVLLFDTVFPNMSNNDGIFFQMDTNFNVKRFKKENCFLTGNGKASDRFVYTGGFDGHNYYGTDTFRGGQTLGLTPIFIRIDTNLNLISHSFANSQTLQEYYLTATTKEKDYVGGVSYGNITWGQASVADVPNEDQFVIWEIPRDSASPSKIYKNQLETSYREPHYLLNDEQGNVFMAGKFTGSVTTQGGAIYSTNQDEDFFVLKWGLDCADSTHALSVPLPGSDLVATATGQHSVQVTWQDESSYEKSFHIYRSPNGTTGWALIDSVTANTTQYIDVNVQPATIYWYRVAAANENGESYYTNIDSALTWRTIGIFETDADLPYVGVYPNPTVGKATLKIYSTEATDASIHITDINGRTVYTSDMSLSSGANSHEVDLANAAAGIYYLSVQTKNGVTTKMISKVE